MVLYANSLPDFIRDPDDPTFHPVRDVLERNMTTQLRKIAFSAMVYGGLVIMCLGGVVWGLDYAFNGVFPIYWSSNEPVLEFPVDLLFYQFLMPLILKALRPSDRLHKLYEWCFKKCARTLRLSHFLLGARREDEEGYYIEEKINQTSNKEVHSPDEAIGTENDGNTESRKSSFKRSGKFVRTPASDQVRLPKDTKAFLEVDENNQRIDGKEDSEKGHHGSKDKKWAHVYIPPFFRVRIGFFIVLIWLFAASTGLSITVLPLVLGRLLFAILLPNRPRTNDIYAFAVGFYFLGALTYTILHIRTFARAIILHFAPSKPHLFTKKAINTFFRLGRIIYTYTAFAVFLPVLFSLVVEAYFFIPLHTHFSLSTLPPTPANTSTTNTTADEGQHILHLIQDWTLGVLCIKTAGRLLFWYGESRPARALRAVIRNGWLDPDVGIATRGFILPATLATAFLLAFPLACGWLVNRHITPSTANADVTRVIVYRYSYPFLMATVLAAVGMWALRKAWLGWRKRIRDEVYLVGERLHNFGETKEKGVTAGSRTESGSGTGREVAAQA